MTPSWRTRGPILVTASAGILFTFLGFQFSQTRLDRAERNEFELRAGVTANALERSIRDTLDSLNGLQGLYAANENVTSAQFSAFVQEILHHGPGIRAIEWAPRVPQEERAAFERACRSEHPGFQILAFQEGGALQPAPDREEYFPIQYVEPQTSNASVLGVDLASELERRDAIERAEATGLTSATVQLRLLQGKAAGFLAMLPIRRGAGRSVRGVCVAVFETEPLIQACLKGQNPWGLRMEIRGSDVAFPEGLPRQEDSALHHLCGINVGGLTWRLDFFPTAAYLSSFSQRESWLILCGGLILTLLSCVFLNAALGRADEVERIVQDRTSALLASNQELALAIAERKRVEDDLQHRATHDHLTGLPNHPLFREHLGQSMADSRRKGRLAGVILFDLDRFKLINETLGHPMGDALLRSVSERLQGWLRQVDTVARMGGDEFLVILSDLARPQDAALVAQKIIKALSEPYRLGPDQDIRITVSMGISLFPVDSEDPDTLIRNADAAMYRAKERGGNTYQFFTSDINAQTMERMELGDGLRHALERNEFLLHYQPQVELSTGRVVGFESVIRWRHPKRGLIPPTKFIPIAEETGLIGEVGEWVLRTACAQGKAWQDAGLPPCRIAVNLSARQLENPGLVDAVTAILEQTGFPARFLELELTESMIMANEESAVLTLGELSAMGIRIAIDDFGTGYSSLNHLKRFPIETLKVDKSFIRDVITDPSDAQIVRAIIAMTHSLRMQVLAEGVETPEQLAFLREHACDLIQGYFISHPVPAENAAGILREGVKLGG